MEWILGDVLGLVCCRVELKLIQECSRLQTRTNYKVI